MAVELVAIRISLRSTLGLNLIIPLSHQLVGGSDLLAVHHLLMSD